MLERCDAIGNALTLQSRETATSAPEKTIREDGEKSEKETKNDALK